MRYPHLLTDCDANLLCCRCGLVLDVQDEEYGEEYGDDCPAAMRQHIADLSQHEASVIKAQARAYAEGVKAATTPAPTWHDFATDAPPACGYGCVVATSPDIPGEHRVYLVHTHDGSVWCHDGADGRAARVDYDRWRWDGETPTAERQGTAILVWRWDDAPGELRTLSDHGGDEDWLALIPAALADEWIGWMESGGSFGCCRVSEHDLPDGRRVRIGAHA